MKRPTIVTLLWATIIFSQHTNHAVVVEGANNNANAINNKVLQSLDKVKNNINTKLFLYKTPSQQWAPSTVYRYDDFRQSLQIMANEGVAGKTFYMGESSVKNDGHVYGLVNIAAFLAQSMKETIQYDACDENSWDLVGGKYPLSNACGQLGQSYQDYHCSPEEAHMECPIDPEMSITAITHAKWYGAPGPLFCGPKTEEQPFSGFWDHIYECNKGWANPPQLCSVYEGQKAGRYDQSVSYANTAGRTDVEGCCWWGRGVIQTSGVCNFGKLNYFLGAGAKNDGRPAKYPKVDFCKDPEVICASSEYKELKWIAGEFYWMESVQSYNEGGWDYTTELRKFVEGGMTGSGFIDGVSGIVNRGCHNPPCGTGAVDGGWERAENFKKVLDVFFDGSYPQVAKSPSISPPQASPIGLSPQAGSFSIGMSHLKPPVDSVSSSTESTPVASKVLWYPDYNSQWSLGKCVSETPIPSGRTTYETGVECCEKSYASQASGTCLISLPQSPLAPNGLPLGASGSGSDSGPDPGISPQTPQTTLKPYLSPSGNPSLGPSTQIPDSTHQPISSMSEAGIIINSKTFIEMDSALESVKDEIDNKLFLYKTPGSQWVPSTVYRYDDFIESLQIMASEGVAGKRFYIGESNVENGHVYGLVNIAAFLAQSMKETIQYDACDENSWDLVGGKYPLSNACGQLGQSYQDYHCSAEEAHMECPVDPEMSVTAVTHAKWYGAPGPLFCGPKTDEQPFSGFWDHLHQCNKGWANPPEVCDIYEGQKAGRYDQSVSYANTGGRTDVEGCCWWGRGVIQTSGVCNFGKLNYYLGAGAIKDGRPAKYPKVDFCKDPEVICASSEYKELKWIAGEFYWMESVQTYNEGGWNYIAELRKFVEGGMTGTGFINGVSGIVNRGCHNPPCGTGAVDGGSERAENFKKVLDVFFDGSYPQIAKPPSISPPQGGSSSISLSPQAGSFSIGLSLEPPSDSSPSAESTDASEGWYPDYNAQWSLGKCVNKTPIPSGKVTYETGVECCEKSYANQASRACLNSLPHTPSTPSGSLLVYPPQTPQTTLKPVLSPSGTPSTGPSTQMPDSTHQPISSMSEAGIIINSKTFIEIDSALESVKDEIDNKLFLYKTPGSQWVPSTVYRYDDFIESLQIMASEGVAGKRFYIGESNVENGHVYGLVNIAAFLAQSMKETIQYDACDENSWDLVGGKYPLSNACGQLGQSYQDYHCSPEEAHMECPVDPEMSITAVTHAKWYGAPGPLFCGPKTDEQPFSGFWDHLHQCDEGWANPPEVCDIYEGQKAGRYDQTVSFANTAGRTDVEGCCWWGRGVIQTSGVCNFGKLNYFLGAGAVKDGRPAKYPKVDFCNDPEVICASSEYKELKWIAGEFYWMESVETYNEGGWNYIAELRKFVEGGMAGTRFINGVSGIVNRGCHNPPCGTGAVDGGWERAENFKKVLGVFFGGSPPQIGSSLAGSSTLVGSSPPGSPPQLGPVLTVQAPGSLAGSGSITSTESIASGRWYPDYNPQWSLGKCVDETPIPDARETYDTGVKCCKEAYSNQASGACVKSLPQPYPALGGAAYDKGPVGSMANAFATSIYTHARQQSNFLAYNCGSSADITLDSLVVDILFDYEIYVPHTAQAAHVLPALKKHIMDDLAHTLGCQAIIRRNLERIAEDEVLLGYHSAVGSDVIDGEKGSCTESAKTDETCVPVIGHIAAFIQRRASVDAMILTKDVIIHSIQDIMNRNSNSELTRRIVYVGEHGSDQQNPSYRNYVDESNENNSSNTFTTIGIALLTVGLFAAVALLVKRKRNKDNDYGVENYENKEGISASTIGNTARMSWHDRNTGSDDDSGGDYGSQSSHSGEYDSQSSSDEYTASSSSSCQDSNGSSEKDHDEFDFNEPGPALVATRGVNFDMTNNSYDETSHHVDPGSAPCGNDGENFGLVNNLSDFSLRLV